jgi:hypothetical protein
MSDMQTEQFGSQDPALTEAMDGLFPETGQSELRRRMIGIGAGVVGVGALVFAHRAGVDAQVISDIFDSKISPTPPVSEEIVDGFVAVNNGLRAVAPPVLLGGLGFRALQRWRSGADEHQAALEEMASIDYSGTDSLTDAPAVERKSFGRVRSAIGRVTAGVGVAALTALFAGGSSGVEDEVSNGPLRPVEAVFDSYSVADSSRHIIVQSETSTFMGDSYIDTEAMDLLAAQAQTEGVTIVPFSKSLPEVDGRSGLVITMPDSMFGQQTGLADTDPSCETVSVISDEATPVGIGETIDINGLEATVGAKIEDTAQMNRDVAIMSQSDFNNCVAGTEDPKYFGAIVSGEGAGETVHQLSEELGVSEQSVVITEEQFEQNNRSFWQKNGTPILLELIAYGGAIGAFAIASERRAAMQRHVREIGTMAAKGIDMARIRSIEVRRAMKDTAKATLIAAPLMPAMAALFNAAEQGLRVGVGLREVAVGYTVALAAKMTGSIRAVRKFGKNLDKAEAVRG